MLIGVPKEIKNHEYRAGLVPGSVHECVHHGHSVIVETGLGDGIGCTDDDYRDSGATIVDSADRVFAEADMVIKVKEPQEVERKMLRRGQILFTYLHLAAEPEVTEALVRSGCIAIGYETVQRDDGFLPLLAPMSEIAGRLAVEIGAPYLKRPGPGRGRKRR